VKMMAPNGSVAARTKNMSVVPDVLTLAAMERLKQEPASV